MRLTVSYAGWQRFSLLALGVLPVLAFTIASDVLLNASLAGDISERTSRQLQASQALLDESRARLVALAATYTSWAPMLDETARLDLASVSRDVLDFQVATGLSDASVLVVGSRSASAGNVDVTSALERLIASRSQPSYVGLGGEVFRVAVVELDLSGRSGPGVELGGGHAWFGMALRIGAADVAELKRVTGWDSAVLGSAGAVSVTSDPTVTRQLAARPADAATIRWDGSQAAGEAPIDDGLGNPAGYLAIATPADPIAALPQRISAVLILVLAGTVAGAVALSVGFGRMLARRARLLETAVSRITAGDLSARLPATDMGDLGRLAASHDRLAEQLERRERELRAVAGSLRGLTPTTSLEVLMPAALRAVVETLDLADATLVDGHGTTMATAAGVAGDPGARAEVALPDPTNLSLAPATPNLTLRIWPGASRPLSEWDQSLLSFYALQLGAALRDARLYAQTRQRADELDRVARLQSNFLRGVSHNLNGPVTSIRTLAEDLADQGGGPAVRARAAAIADEAQRLRRLVEQLLLMARLDAGTITLDASPFAPVPLVRRIWDSRRSTRVLEFDDRSAGLLVVADRAAVEQVLWMLFDNALAYAPTGPIAVRLEGRRDRDGTMLVMRVSDRGPGVPPEERDLIFDRFRRGSTSVGTDGTGLGLDVARGLLAAMGGSIWYEADGPGATFAVAIPAEEPTP